MHICFRYIYFFEKGNPQIAGAAIQSLVELINTEMQGDSTTRDPASDAFFTSTLRYIQFQKQKGGAMGEKYEPIKVWIANTFKVRCLKGEKFARQVVWGLMEGIV